MLDKTWQKMYQKAKAVQGFREISSHMEAGGVAACQSYLIQVEPIPGFVLILRVL